MEADLINQGTQPGPLDRAFLMEALKWPEKE